MLGDGILNACKDRRGVVGTLARGYLNAGGARARARYERQLRERMPEDLVVKLYLSDIGRRGGSQTSASKAEAARQNGSRGGRPAARGKRKRSKR